MDIATHAVTSLVLARGILPRHRWPVVAGMVFAGTVADSDLISLVFGPAAFLAARRTFTHSIIGALAIITSSAALTFFALRRGGALSPRGTGSRQSNLANNKGLAGISLAVSCAAIAHFLLDICQSDGVDLLPALYIDLPHLICAEERGTR